MIRSNQAGQAKNRPPRREEGENGNLQRFPYVFGTGPNVRACALQLERKIDVKQTNCKTHNQHRNICSGFRSRPISAGYAAFAGSYFHCYCSTTICIGYLENRAP
ncbi:hypothetical protein [Profundibacter sp.]|uniref:hypothetical protein n=1 Tax=Profundibacter sp. TaxID=3101071 RepID=UPI003D0EC54F